MTKKDLKEFFETYPQGRLFQIPSGECYLDLNTAQSKAGRERDAIRTLSSDNYDQPEGEAAKTKKADKPEGEATKVNKAAKTKKADKPEGEAAKTKKADKPEGEASKDSQNSGEGEDSKP